MSAPGREAGRELDALVAGRVFGYFGVQMYEGGLVHGERNMNGWPVPTPFYSTDIAAAMDALAQVGGIVKIARLQPNEWHVGGAGLTTQVWAETLPHAICLYLLAITDAGSPSSASETTRETAAPDRTTSGERSE